MPAITKYKLILNVCLESEDPEFLKSIYDELKSYIDCFAVNYQISGQIIQILDPCRCGERKQPNVQKNPQLE